MTDHAGPRVFTIAPGAPYLKTLANALCDGSLIQGFRDDGDPLALADVTVYVPTRRAARALRTEFAQRNASKSAILPTIRPLGEFDDDAGFFDEAGAAALELKQPINAEERILQLAKLVRHWAGHLPSHIRDLFGTDAMVVPTTPSDAVWLARNLADLMDEVEREGGDWAKLKSQVVDELAGWWQLTLEFLQIVSTHWPEYLDAQNLTEPTAYRNAIVRSETERLKRDGARGPVIAAGSTGSVPATAELLEVIANLQQGAVVLPGLDLTMAGEAWAALEQNDVPSIFGHPQYGLKQLLKRFKIERSDVASLGVVSSDLQKRSAIIAQALLPADATYMWAQQSNFDMSEGFANVSELVASSESQEALGIAIALREAIETGAYPAALVTTDRTLARRVSAELERFGIKADDSGGTPLDQTAPAALFQLVLDVVFSPTDPVRLLALLKHPLACLGNKREKTRGSAEALELIALRGGVAPLDLALVLERLRTGALEDDALHTPANVTRLKAIVTEDAIELAIALTAALDPLLKFSMGAETTNVSTACRISVAAFEAIGRDENNSLQRLYAGDAGEAMAEHLRALVGVEADYAFLPQDWPSIYKVMISGKSVKPKTGSDPRVHIWGALEARLQHVETIILGGLNEKSWPARPSDDPFLSRGMKAGIEIGSPERRIGLAAHDFQMLTGTKNVILSRSARSEGAPSVASRWMQRLHAVIGDDSVNVMQARAAHLLHWSRLLDVGINSHRVSRPNPRPALHLRPKGFSVTEIETLIRDPYAVHAKRILGLQPLQPLLREQDARERGQLFHKIVEMFVRTRKSAPGTSDELKAVGTQLFKEEELPEQTHALWWRRFERMVDEFIAFETEREPFVKTAHVELWSGKILIEDTGITLHGRADRIDVMKAGGAEIIDYKSGTTPSAKQVLELLAPQLPLEAALLARQGFLNGKTTRTDDLLYISFKPDGSVVPLSILQSKANKEPVSAGELGERAWAKLTDMLRFYLDEKNGYISRKAPFKEATDGDYDHLARVMEWSAGGDDKGASDE